MKLKHLLCFIPALLIASCNPVYANEKQQQEQILEQTGANLLEKFGNKALEYTQALEEITKQYTPDVVDAALKVVQLNGVFSLLEAFVWFLPFCIISCICLYYFWKGVKEDDDDKKFFSILISIIPCIVTGIAISHLINIWSWVAIFEPKLWIAYKILGKLL